MDKELVPGKNGARIVEGDSPDYLEERPRTISDAEGWTQVKPSIPGLYLRTELWGTPVHAVVEEYGGELFIGLRRLSLFDERTYWLGPLPEIPSSATICERKKREPKTTRKNSPSPLIAGALYDFCEYLAHNGFLSVMGLLEILRKFAAERDLDLVEADTRSWWKIPQTRYQIRRKESGLCIMCGVPAVTTRLCQLHADKHNERQREKRAMKELASYEELD